MTTEDTRPTPLELAESATCRRRFAETAIRAIDNAQTPVSPAVRMSVRRRYDLAVAAEFAAWGAL